MYIIMILIFNHRFNNLKPFKVVVKLPFFFKICLIIGVKLFVVDDELVFWQKKILQFSDLHVDAHAQKQCTCIYGISINIPLSVSLTNCYTTSQIFEYKIIILVLIYDTDTKYRDKPKCHKDIINLHFIFVFINQRPFCCSFLYLCDMKQLYKR